jgi:hypothetical protein
MEMFSKYSPSHEFEDAPRNSDQQGNPFFPLTIPTVPRGKNLPSQQEGEKISRDSRDDNPDGTFENPSIRFTEKINHHTSAHATRFDPNPLLVARTMVFAFCDSLSSLFD